MADGLRHFLSTTGYSHEAALKIVASGHKVRDLMVESGIPPMHAMFVLVAAAAAVLESSDIPAELFEQAVVDTLPDLRDMMRGWQDRHMAPHDDGAKVVIPH